jgi:hypothetical protein
VIRPGSDQWPMQWQNSYRSSILWTLAAECLGRKKRQRRLLRGANEFGDGADMGTLPRKKRGKTQGIAQRRRW